MNSGKGKLGLPMPKSGKYTKLFEPANIGSLECKNRFIMAAMGTRLASETSGVNDYVIDFYVERAKGGVGLIISEAAFVVPSGGLDAYPRLSVAGIAHVPGLNRLAEAIQAYGTKFTIQLHYPEISESGTPFGPSDIPASKPIARLPTIVPKPMTVEDVEAMVRAFASGARISKMAGADAVEVHAAHGHLLSQFLSPLCNRRTDKYGGSVEKRGQVLTEIIEGIKRELGKDFPVIVKINGEDGVAGGLVLEEAIIIAQMIEKAGADAIGVSAGTTGFTMDRIIQPMFLHQCTNARSAEAIKKSVNVPVIAVGSINEPDLAENILREGQADFISIGRALLADPYYVQKTKEGRIDDIRQCIRCCVGCAGRVRDLFHISCTVNAAVGKEREFVITPSAKSKKVLVVGGGPAGMEAARVAALRGHTVTLYEEDDKPGGQMLLAAIPPHKGEIEIFRNYLLNQLNKLKVDIKLRKEATYETIKKENPDVVIIAAGGVPCIPSVPGADSRNSVTMDEVLFGKVKVGEKVAIIGGGLVGCETALKLSADGKKVTIIECLDEIMPTVTEIIKMSLFRILEENGVDLRAATNVTAIEEEGVHVSDKQGKEEFIEVDNVVFAVGSILRNDLPGKLEEEFKVFRVGDCVEPRDIFNAVREGSFIARQI